MGRSAGRGQGGGGAAAAAGLLRASFEHDLGPIGAFLPDRVPLDHLPHPLQRYLDACTELPARYPTGDGVRGWLDREFRSDDVAVRRSVARSSPAERETLMTALCALGHTYRWDTVPPARERFEEQRIGLPPGISAPWTQLARVLGQPRVGTAWSLHLCNWKMTARPGGAAYTADELTADTVRMARTWLRPPVDGHLERFSISFVLLEARGAVALRHMVDGVEAAARRDHAGVLTSLECLREAIDGVTLAFSLSVRARTVDPAIWLELIQPTFPWSAEADVPGCTEGGPSGMQVAIIQALDSALGIVGDSPIARSAVAGRRAMPRAHRRFLRTLDLAAPVLRHFVVESRCPILTDAFNRCIRSVVHFRTTHRARGALYLRSRPRDGVGRTSTGLTIGTGDDSLAVFDCAMSERTLESQAATLPFRQAAPP